MSFTFGSAEFMEEIFRRGTQRNYPIGLNSTDFKVFVTILHKLALYGGVSHHDFDEVLTFDPLDIEEPIERWAWDFLSSIGETLNIEGI